MIETALPRRAETNAETTAALDIEPIAAWPVPVWSRGVALDASTYCFADMKGAICLLDVTEGSVREVARLDAPITADLARVRTGEEAAAAAVSHSGELVLVERSGRTRRSPAPGRKVRAGLRTVDCPDGTSLLAVIDSRSRLSLIDPTTLEPTGFGVSLRHWPPGFDYGVVAAPLFFRVGGRNKVFLTGRSGVACQIDLEAGRVDWSDLLPYGVDSDPALDAGQIYFSSGESLYGRVRGRLYCLDAASRRLAWSADLDGGADVQPLLTDWHGCPAVVTATLMDASIYVFDRRDGRLLERARVPETPACRHGGGQCVPVGYGVYHTQTTVCKFYAAPFAGISPTGRTTALYAASHNGRLYGLDPDGRLHTRNLMGSVRAGPTVLEPDTLLIHAGTRMLRVRARSGERFATAAATDRPQGPAPEPGQMREHRFAPRHGAMAWREVRNRLERRLLGRKTE